MARQCFSQSPFLEEELGLLQVQVQAAILWVVVDLQGNCVLTQTSVQAVLLQNAQMLFKAFGKMFK